VISITAGGATWQDSNVFDGLTPDTEYEFVMRMRAKDNYLVGEISAVLSVTTKKAAQSDDPQHQIQALREPAIRPGLASGAYFCWAAQAEWRWYYPAASAEGTCNKINKICKCATKNMEELQ